MEIGLREFAIDVHVAQGVLFVACLPLAPQHCNSKSSPKWSIWSNLSRPRDTQKISIFLPRILHLSHPPRDNRVGDPNGIRTRVTAVKGRYCMAVSCF